MNKIYIFDIDNTLIDTQAKVILKYSDGTTKYLNSMDFNNMDNYQLRNTHSEVLLDFSEFDNLEQLLQEPIIQKNWDPLVEAYQNNHPIYILTSRYCYKEIHQWLIKNGITIPPDHILTRANITEYINTHATKFKKEMIFKLIDRYGNIPVHWYEDDIKVIQEVMGDNRYEKYKSIINFSL